MTNPTRPIFTAGKPAKTDAWVEEALQEYDTFHLDGKYFHKTPKQIRDWLRTALTTLLAEREAEIRREEQKRVIKWAKKYQDHHTLTRSMVHDITTYLTN